MQNETASTAFLEFGSVYKTMDDALRAELTPQTRAFPEQRFQSQFFCFSSEVYLEIRSGLGILLASRDIHEGPIQEFGMNQRIQMNPGVYFSFVPTTPELVVDFYVRPDCAVDVISLATPYEYHPLLPRIQIIDILGCYYRIRTPGYRFKGENHPFFELTYVDTGKMFTEVDGATYQLGEKELILYGPGQHHTQYTDQSQSVSYVTILFEMKNLAADMPENWYEPLINKVFPQSKKTYTLMKTMVQESATAIPYRDTLMHCLLTETIVRLLQVEFTAPQKMGSSIVRQNYQDELFNSIVTFIESKLYEPLTVADVCQQFSLSRSSLQLLFKNTVGQSPKKFISDMKLKKSCEMLRENKYTVSEISLKLGYSSIHYFSNTFNQKYHISPSEYAKRIY